MNDYRGEERLGAVLDAIVGRSPEQLSTRVAALVNDRVFAVELWAAVHHRCDAAGVDQRPHAGGLVYRVDDELAGLRAWRQNETNVSLVVVLCMHAA